MARIALRHHGRRFEDAVGNFSNGQLFVEGLAGAEERRVRREHKVNARVRDQVGLEFRHVDVEGTVEAEGSSRCRFGNRCVLYYRHR